MTQISSSITLHRKPTNGKDGLNGNDGITLTLTPDRYHCELSRDGEFALGGPIEVVFDAVMYFGSQRITQFTLLNVTFDNRQIIEGDESDISIATEYSDTDRCFTGRITLRINDTMVFNSDQLALNIVAATRIAMTGQTEPTAISRTATFLLTGSRKGTNGTNGKDGKDGITPTIDPATGNWIINGEVTDYPSAGDDGNPPYINPETGTWWEWDADNHAYHDTHIKAQGDKGDTGASGADAITLSLSTPVVAFPTLNGMVATGAVARTVKASLFRGSAPMIISALTTDWQKGTPYSVSVNPAGNEITITPLRGSIWSNDYMLNITATVLKADGSSIQRTASLNIVGSAQGQTVTGPQGAGISKVEEYYLATSEVDAEGTPIVPEASAPAWSTNHILPTASLPYVWNKEVIYVKDPVTQVETPVSTDIHLSYTFSDGLLTYSSLYLATSIQPDDLDPSLINETLTDAMADFNVANRYLYNREVATYRDASKNRDDVRLLAVWGEKGPQGDKGEQGDKGDSAIEVNVSTSAIAVKKSNVTQTFHVYVRVSRGNTPLVCVNMPDHPADFTCSVLADSAYIVPGLRWSNGSQDEGKVFIYTLRLSANTLANVNIPFTVTVGTEVYKYEINFSTVDDGERGLPGYEGCVIRTSEWEPSKQYRNDSALTPSECLNRYGDPTRYLDEVVVSDFGEEGRGKAYICLHSHVSVDTDKDSTKETLQHTVDNLNCWEALQIDTPLRTPFADIDQALIQYLQVQQITLQRQSDAPDGSYHKGDIYGAIGGSDNYPLWFGGTSVQTANAKIGSDGSVYFNNGTFQGSIHARNFGQELTECIAEEYYRPSLRENFEEYEHNPELIAHEIGDMSGSYYAACAIDTFSPSQRTGNVRHWIILPHPTADLVGKTFEFIVPNFASQGNVSGTDIYNQPIGITSYNGTLTPADTPAWVDYNLGGGNAIDHQDGCLVPLWSRLGKFSRPQAYTAAILCARRYVTDLEEENNDARLRLVCMPRTIGHTPTSEGHTYYQWAILLSQNVHFTTDSQTGQIDQA